MSKRVVPVNTDKGTRWALSNFEAWETARNEQHPNDVLLMCTDPATLKVHFGNKENGEKYPPKTMHRLPCGILRHEKCKSRMSQLSR